MVDQFGVEKTAHPRQNLCGQTLSWFPPERHFRVCVLTQFLHVATTIYCEAPLCFIQLLAASCRCRTDSSARLVCAPEMHARARACPSPPFAGQEERHEPGGK